MSFGFGSNNNSNQASTGFGGFGSSNTGFGATNNTSTGSIFGGGNTATSGGFGSGGGGFGANNTSSPFGAKPASTGFGAAATTSGGGLFGANTSTSGGFGGSGGFGSNNAAATTGGFASGNTGGGMFGQKPASTGFGATNTGGSVFGAGNTSGGFGNNANNTSSNPFAANTGSTGFGAANTSNAASTGFGGFGASNSTAATTNNGTAGTPFAAFQEKDAASNQTSHYQSITFQAPYAKKSFEELRVEDYLQGRRYGNSNGQAGSFGQSTGFGGGIFGGNNNQTSSSTNGGLFGNNNAATTSASTGFGGFGANNNQQQQQPAAGGFGSSTTGGGLFGQNKPATGGLFGSTQSTAAPTGGFGSTAGSGGGLFGGGGGGFGTNNQTSNTGGGLFGANNNNQQQAKPAFGGFGSTNTTTGGFGANTGTTGGLFGSTTNTANTNTGGGLFGSTNNNQPAQQQSNPFGASTNTGGGLFGSTQNKPATGGLFGSTTNTANTGGSLFGASNNQQQQSGGLFGANNNQQQQSGGLFGSNQNKPATGGLFGGGTTNTNTGGSLFGAGNNQQQQPGGSLFGGNTTAGNSLFSNNQNKPAGSSLFGGNTGTNTGSSIFGGNNQSNQQGNSGGSLFGGSLGQSNNQGSNSLFGNATASAPQNNQLHASLTASPYGNDQLFSSLGQTSAPVGPLATPLNGAKPTPSKTPSLLSSTRLNSPIYTPRASVMNRAGTYGMSFSTFGTPGSAYSASLTPQQSSLLKPTGSLGSALTSRLAKSMSMNNLRGDGTPTERESLLRPTPGSTSSKYLQSGSMRKLIIDRSLRTDLFASPEPNRQQEPARSGAEADTSDSRKRVSFDHSTAKQSNAQPSADNALVRTDEESENETSPGPLRAAPAPRSQPNGKPEMEQVNGSTLSPVHEDRVPPRPLSAPVTKRPALTNSEGIEIGDYWTKPSIRDLKNMSRQQLQHLGKFTVGRDGVGSIEFGACDLTNTTLDDICGKIVILELRVATVYPNKSMTPARGQGLNVPSTIRLEHSLPANQGKRKKVMLGSGPHFERHLERLKRTSDTKFVSFDAKTGVWTFTVEHFTTYGFDDDEDEATEDMDIQQETSGLSEPPEDESMQSIEAPSSVPEDDTFGYQKKRTFPRLPQTRLPGGFDESDFINNTFDEPSPADGEDETMMSGGNGDDVFTEQGGAVQAPSPGAIERYHSSMIADDEAGEDYFAEDTQVESDHDLMPGSFVAEEPKLLRSILKPTTGISAFTSPEKLATESWEEQLQRTMSPKKRDRQALAGVQQIAFRDQPADTIESPFKRSMLGQSALGQSAFGNSYLAQKSANKSTGVDLSKSQAFRTSMDIMNSLWAQEKTTKKAPGATRGFENPYPKRPRLSASSELDEHDAAFHDSLKHSFANTGTFVYAVPAGASRVGEPLAPAIQSLIGGHKELRFAKWVISADINAKPLSAQKQVTSVKNVDGFPYARTSGTTPFRDTEAVTNDAPENAIWQLADILFDTVVVACADLIDETMDAETIMKYEPRMRMDKFAIFWRRMLESEVAEQISLASTAEEKAMLRLTLNDVAGACELLTATKNFKLATLVAQLPGSEDSRELMQAQIDTWVSRNDWSEMPDTARALYSIVAGECCNVVGKSGPPENRASSFSIAERFGLSWMQSFGLRVFFGGYESLEQTAHAYVDDLTDGHEKVTPAPKWASEAGEQEHDREDTLLGLLRIFIGCADLEAVFDAKTITGKTVNSRIAWQLASFMSAKGHAHNLSDEKFDSLTINFAAELEAANAFVTAAWVLLHLRNAQSRKTAVTELLYRNARYIGEPGSVGDEDGTWEFLVGENKLPEALLWTAKALHARAELGNAYLQTKYLLNARATTEAHEVLCKTIGPQAVIEEDYDALQETLHIFDHIVGEPNLPQIPGWVSGGQVFNDFVYLVTTSGEGKYGVERERVMKRLDLGLAAMEGKEGSMTLECKVALVEMGRVLKEEMRENAVYESNGMDGVEVGLGAFERYREAMGIVA